MKRFHDNVQDDEYLLLNRARALELEALEQIHDMYYVPIFRYISLRVNEHETAEDLTSEVFTRLLSALQDKTAPQKTIRGWLYSVASRVVKDFYRKKYRRKQVTLIIALRFGYEMSIRDVAETTGKSEGAVKMLQARAIAALSRTMQSGE
ncbi:MAG: sigma factor [Anaerolineae bacterium]